MSIINIKFGALYGFMMGASAFACVLFFAAPYQKVTSHALSIAVATATTVCFSATIARKKWPDSKLVGSAIGGAVGAMIYLFSTQMLKLDVVPALAVFFGLMMSLLFSFVGEGAWLLSARVMALWRA